LVSSEAQVKIKRQLIVSSEGESEDKEIDDFSVVREEVKIKGLLIVNSAGESEDKERADRW
jgi:hypothetical protein